MLGGLFEARLSNVVRLVSFQWPPSSYQKLCLCVCEWCRWPGLKAEGCNLFMTKTEAVLPSKAVSCAGDVGKKFVASFEDATFFGLASVVGTIRSKPSSIRREGINRGAFSQVVIC